VNTVGHKQPECPNCAYEFAVAGLRQGLLPTFMDLLVLLRHKYALTQEKLAEGAEMALWKYQRIEQGTRSTAPQDLVAIISGFQACGCQLTPYEVTELNVAVSRRS